MTNLFDIRSKTPRHGQDDLVLKRKQLRNESRGAYNMANMATASEMTPQQALSGITDETKARWKRMYLSEASSDEAEQFYETVIRTRLSPDQRQIYVRMQSSKAKVNHQWVWQKKMLIMVSIDGFRLVAERTGKYAGQETALFSADGKSWTEAWSPKDPPKFAKVGILRHDFKKPLFVVAKWDTFKQETKDNKLTRFWANMPEVMLSKVAEAQAFRRAFPQELSGLYEPAEITETESESLPTTPKIIRQKKEETPVELPAPELPNLKITPYDKANKIHETMLCSQLDRWKVENYKDILMLVSERLHGTLAHEWPGLIKDVQTKYSNSIETTTEDIL